MAARTERGEPSPRSRESATSALSDDERGGRSGPGIKRDILPLADRVRKFASWMIAVSSRVVSRLGGGGWAEPCLLGMADPAGDEVERCKAFEVADVK
jgi:hypothetical protein